MTSMEKLKRTFDNFLANDYDRREYEKYYVKLKEIQNFKKYFHRQLLLNIGSKKTFIDLHFLKMLEYYIYLRFYHENITKLLHNEKLLRYFEKVLINKGFDPYTWDEEYNLVGLLEDIIYFLPG